MPDKFLTTKRKVLIAVAVVVVIALVVLLTWLLFTHPHFTAVAGNLSIIILALVLMLMNIFIIIMLWQVIRLVDFLLGELKPVMENLQQTSSTVRGTAGFVGEEVTNPIIDVSAKAAGVKGSMRFVMDTILNPARQSRGRPAEPRTPTWPPADPYSDL